MSDYRSRRWFQLSLKSLFLLTLVVAALFAGYSLATKQAHETVRAEQEARRQAEEAHEHKAADLARLQRLNVVVFRHNPGAIDSEGRMNAGDTDAATIREAAPMPGKYWGGLGSGFQLSISASDLPDWSDAIEKLLQSGTLRYYNCWGLDKDGYGLVPVR